MNQIQKNTKTTSLKGDNSGRNQMAVPTSTPDALSNSQSVSPNEFKALEKRVVWLTELLKSMILDPSDPF